MFEELLNLVEKRKERKLIEKLDGSHERALNSFASFNINIGPVPIVIAPQEDLRDLHNLKRYLLDLSYDRDTYIEGMYSGLNDMIFLDEDTCRRESARLDYVITHEYAHRLFRIFMKKIEERGRKQQNINLGIAALPGSTENINPFEELRRYVESLQKEGRTKDERRRLEFEIYFDEMFAVSAGLYLTGQIGDEGWFRRSAIYAEDTLKEDGDFLGRLESTLYKAFFERMFSYGFRKVAIELPTSYQITRTAFEKRYQKALSENTIIL